MVALSSASVLAGTSTSIAPMATVIPIPKSAWRVSAKLRRLFIACGPRTIRRSPGNIYPTKKPIKEPKGVQRPHPPLWLAGSGEKVTLKMVAQWGDGCNVGGRDLANVRHKMNVLREHCGQQGRDFNELSRSVCLDTFLVDSLATAEQETSLAYRKGESFDEFQKRVLVCTEAQLIEHVETLIAEGISSIIFYLPRTAYDLTQMQRVAANVLPHFNKA